MALNEWGDKGSRHCRKAEGARVGAYRSRLSQRVYVALILFQVEPNGGTHTRGEYRYLIRNVIGTADLYYQYCL